MTDLSLHTSAASLWPDLRTKAGLTGARSGRKGAYDQDLLDALRARLFPGAAGSLDALIQASDLSAEQLIRALFATLRPFAVMQKETLAMLSAAGAVGSGDSLPIRFHFDPDGAPLDLLLGDFRRQTETLAVVLQPTIARPPFGRFWEIPRAGAAWGIGDLSREGSTPGLIAWRGVYDGGGFPPLPDDWRTGRSDVDARLERVVRLADQVLSDVRDQVADRHELMDVARTIQIVDSDELDTSFQVAAVVLETDLWASKVVGWLERIRVAVGRGDETVLQAMMVAIDQCLPAVALERRSPVSVLEDILDLPVWRHRHDLYAVWLGSQIFRALGPAGWRFDFNLTDGRLEFAFRGVQLASLTPASGSTPTLEWWTELETAHDDLPSGRRSRGAKPDYRIRTLPAAGDGAPTPTDLLVLEAKQHLRSATAEFADALNDYAAACPQAVVLLANHGPVSGKVASHCDPASSHRCRALGSVHPGEPEAVRALNELIVSGLDSALSGRPGAMEAFASAEIRLEWGALPRDLDLYVSRTEGTREQVFFSRLSAPGLEHRGDVTSGFGPEVATITASEGIYLVTVRQHSSDGDLATSGARVTIAGFTAAGAVRTVSFEVPARVSETVWSVARIDMARGEIGEVAGAITPKAP